MAHDTSGGRQPPIGDYALLGDCRTAALVSRDGSMDWLCLPRFDGGAVFAALLDPERGGRFRVRPTGEYTTERRYLPDTNVLETTFRTEGGTLRLTDAMTVPMDPASLFPDHEVLRRAECLDGRVELEVLLDPRFDFGRRVPRGKDRGRLGIFFDGGADGLALRTDLPLARRDGAPGWAGRQVLEAGDRRYFSLTSERAAPLTLQRLGEPADARLEHTARWWREWVGGCVYEGRYRELVFRSMLTLKLLAYPPSGAIIAAPTASLPEDPGGSRNWDYRYCWLRDASMTIEVLLHLGFAREGEAFLAWLLHATRLTRPRFQVLYDVHGRTRQTEREHDHLAGYRDSRPVRTGNDAVAQRQLDLYGEVLRAAWSFVNQGGELGRAEGRLLADLAETICESWDRPDNGIWEVRGDMRHYTYSKVMAWVGLRCLLDLADAGALEPGRPRSAIEEEMAAIRRRTEAEGWNEEVGSYVAWYGADQVDAALLLLGVFGYEEPGSERMEATRRVVRERLGDHGLLRRYAYDDGLPGREGAFGICAFWEAELLARQGRVEQACQVFDHATSYANDVGLLSEEMDAETGALLGNFPQAFTHIGLVSAANAIARARGRPPEERATRPERTEAEARS